MTFLMKSALLMCVYLFPNDDAALFSHFLFPQSCGRMSSIVTPLVRFSTYDNATYPPSTTLVAALDNVTSAPLTTARADVNITVPHKCLLLLYEDIGTSR